MTITALPAAPNTGDPPDVFIPKADAFVAALSVLVTEMNAAIAVVNMTKWISGTTYAQGDVTWSPINFQAYRRKIAGAGTTDPSADSTNWALAIESVPSADQLAGASQAAAITWAAKQIFTATMKVQQLLEKLTITASAPVTAFDCLTQAIQYFTSNATANWTLNFRGDAGTALNAVMAVGESMTVTVMVTQGATPYYPNVIQVDGAAVTPKWLGGLAPTAGDASSINVYTFTIIKTAGATFTVLASKSKYA